MGNRLGGRGVVLLWGSCCKFSGGDVVCVCVCGTRLQYCVLFFVAHDLC